MSSGVFKLIRLDTLTEDDLSVETVWQERGRMTLLHWAAYYDSGRSFKLLLKKYPELLWETTSLGATAWYYCHQGSTIERLLSDTKWVNYRSLGILTDRVVSVDTDETQDIFPFSFLVLF